MAALLSPRVAMMLSGDTSGVACGAPGVSGNIAVDLGNVKHFRLAEQKGIHKQSRLKLNKLSKKEDYHIAVRTWEEVHMLKCTSEDNEDEFQVGNEEDIEEAPVPSKHSRPCEEAHMIGRIHSCSRQAVSERGSPLQSPGGRVSRKQASIATHSRGSERWSWRPNVEDSAPLAASDVARGLLAQRVLDQRCSSERCSRICRAASTSERGPAQLWGLQQCHMGLYLLPGFNGSPEEAPGCLRGH
ncbi:hypothetical protein NDU88_000498 [Pleurodeles waltl]|uniref:Uncharacterized protein n=1 Tax=Pleurodeles waltl TaxID=8319 RepID=A0AAV7UQ67_PLEWA|nr:hypothetical protein NDU88_000498 [Pleurodeles waltl]